MHSRLAHQFEQRSMFQARPIAGLRMGRIVMFTLNFGPKRNLGEVRPAIVTRIWDPVKGIVNLRLFTDGVNDSEDGKMPWAILEWMTHVHYDPTGKALGTWHFAESEDAV